MLRCKEVTTVIASEELERSSWMKRLAVKLHLLMCKHCRRYYSQIKAIGEAAREIFRARPSRADEKRIMDMEVSLFELLPGAEGGEPPGEPPKPPRS
jgi:predicted anti-sigma-YlaC factor YlaD